MLGDEMDQDIINYVRARYNLLVGERTAETIKIESGSAFPIGKETRVPLRGRDLATGLPTTIMISTGEIREALSNTTRAIIDAIISTLEDTPPELVSDIYDRGLYLTGGGALLSGMPELVAKEAKTPTILTPEPLTTVVRGAGEVLEDVSLLERVRLASGVK